MKLICSGVRGKLFYPLGPLTEPAVFYKCRPPSPCSQKLPGHPMRRPSKESKFSEDTKTCPYLLVPGRPGINTASPRFISIWPFCFVFLKQDLAGKSYLTKLWWFSLLREQCCLYERSHTQGGCPVTEAGAEKCIHKSGSSQTPEGGKEGWMPPEASQEAWMMNCSPALWS